MSRIWNRDLQTIEPTLVCAECAHTAYHHRPECGWTDLNGVTGRCRCPRFTTAEKDEADHE